MKIALYSFALISCLTVPAIAQDNGDRPALAASAQINEPPSQSKLVLIRRFMKASGLQEKLDSGSFLERYAFVRELDWQKGKSNASVMERLSGPMDALKSTYQKYRPLYQKAYEDHLNWEFTEQELLQMSVFLESAVGRHYLDGTWRMDAYTRTNMEDTEAALVDEAVAAYQKQ